MICIILTFHHTIVTIGFKVSVCSVCSSLSFLKLYETEARLARPAPQINRQFQQEQQQCTAEFLYEFCRVLGLQIITRQRI